MKFPKAYSIEEIAAICHAEVLVQPKNNEKILGSNELHVVEEGDISFVDHPKYYQKTLNSKASFVIINAKEVENPLGKGLIYSQDPFHAFNLLTKHFKGFEPCSSSISESAIIGEGSVIQANAFIGNHVKIGRNCLIHSNVSIYDHCVIGDNVIIHANAVIGADAFYFQKKQGAYRKFLSSGREIIEDDVEIGALCAIDKGVSSDTTIGKGTKLDNFVQIGHDTKIGKHCLIGSHSAVAGVTIVEDDVLIWAQVMINKDISIGKGVIVLATSAVDKSISGEGKVFFGSPAVEVRTKWRELASLRALPDFMAATEKALKNKAN